jgi:hypothetical protein
MTTFCFGVYIINQSIILTILAEKRLRIRFLSFFSVPGTALSLDDVKKVRQDVQIVHVMGECLSLMCFRLKIAYKGQKCKTIFG